MLKFDPGTVIVDRYRVKRKIGKGGMGEVYLVRDITSGERRALKTILPQYSKNQKVVDRFIREVNAQRILDHPGIVKILGARKVEDTLFYVMEYLDGVNVRAMLRYSAVSVPTTFRVLYLLCQALEHAHIHTVHRDLSPDNVMVTRDGKVKLLDFGLAKLTETDSDLTRTGMFLGKIHYSAPEQGENAKLVDLRADIYSLGVMFFEMSSGSLPTAQSTLSNLVPELPEEIDAFIDKARSKDPEDRFPNALEFRKELVRIHGIYAGIDYPEAVLNGDVDPEFIKDPSETVAFVHEFIKSHVAQQKADGKDVPAEDDDDDETEMPKTVPVTKPGEMPDSEQDVDSGVVARPTEANADEIYELKKEVARLASSLRTFDGDFGNLAKQFKDFVEEHSKHGNELAEEQAKLERLHGDFESEREKIADLREKIGEQGDSTRKYSVQLNMIENTMKQVQADLKGHVEHFEKLRTKVNKSLGDLKTQSRGSASPHEDSGSLELPPAQNNMIPIIGGAVAGAIVAAIISLIL